VSSTFRIDYVEKALIALLLDVLPSAYGSKVQVESLGDADFNADGQLTLRPPCIRVRYLGADYDPLHDNKRLTYQPKQQFELLCFESSLRSKTDQRRQTLVLVATVRWLRSGWSIRTKGLWISSIRSYSAWKRSRNSVARTDRSWRWCNRIS
jgi:hypothetical protein